MDPPNKIFFLEQKGPHVHMSTPKCEGKLMLQIDKKN